MILGAVIAGGRAQRFGSDKALAEIAGRPMLDLVLERLQPWVDHIVVCGRRHKDWTSLPDRPAAGLGPIGGLNAALRHAASHGFEAVLSVPCDTPWIDPDVYAALLAQPAAAVVAGCPIIGRWPTRLADAIDHFVATDERRSVRGWAQIAEAVALDLPTPRNINFPADLFGFSTPTR